MCAEQCEKKSSAQIRGKSSSHRAPLLGIGIMVQLAAATS